MQNPLAFFKSFYIVLLDNGQSDEKTIIIIDAIAMVTDSSSE